MPSVLLQSAEQLLHVQACKFYTRLGPLTFHKLASYLPPQDLRVGKRGCDMSSQEIKVYYIWLFPLCAGTWTMVTARLLRSELALEGGREEALNGGLQLIPGYWAGFLGWGWAPLLPQVWRQGSGRIWGSLFLLCAHCEESFHSLGAHCLGISVHWSEPFFLFKGGSGKGVNSPWGLSPLG